MSRRVITTPEPLAPFILDTRQDSAVIVKVQGRRVSTLGPTRVIVTDQHGAFAQMWLRYDPPSTHLFQPGLAPVSALKGGQ